MFFNFQRQNSNCSPPREIWSSSSRLSTENSDFIFYFYLQSYPSKILIFISKDLHQKSWFFISKSSSPKILIFQLQKLFPWKFWYFISKALHQKMSHPISNSPTSLSLLELHAITWSSLMDFKFWPHGLHE